MTKSLTTFLPCFALALWVPMIYSPPANAEYDFQVVTPPGADFAQTFGINNSGKVVGGALFGPTEFSFTYDMKNGEYTTISDEFGLLEINNSGVMVGDGDDLCAIRDRMGNITFFVPPSYTPDSSCQARGVNSSGEVSGFVIDEFGEWLGFAYDPKKGTFEEFLPSPQTVAHGINAHGQIAGSVSLDADEAFTGSVSGRYGYLRQTDGAVKFFSISQGIPGFTRGRGISDSGLVTGFYVDPNTFESKSFVISLSAGTEFEDVTLNNDQVVYQKPCDPELPPAPGPGYELFTSIFASQIRNDGVIVGSCFDEYFDGSNFISYGYGFIATPIN